MAIDNPFRIFKKYDKNAPIQLKAMARDLGIKVYECQLPDSIYGKLSLEPEKGSPSGYAIYINGAKPEALKRFTIAHEIAHFALHRDLIGSEIIDRSQYRSDLGEAYETQANSLAAEIVMPAELVRSEYRTEPDAGVLARKFLVPREAMEIRLRSLGIDAVHRPAPAVPVS